MPSLHDAAYRALLHNLRRGPAPAGLGLDEYVYTCPAHGIYPHQWLWDSCFHVIVMARFDADLAKAELRTLLAGARPDGMVPQVISWDLLNRSYLRGHLLRWLYGHSHFAHLTQPPVLAISVEEVFKHSGDVGFLQEVLPACKGHYDYLAAERDPDRDGLLSIVMPIESGMDHSPSYDLALNLTLPTALHHQWCSLKLTFDYLRAGWDTERILAMECFSVEDVAFNSIYALGLRSLVSLCEAVGDGDAERYRARAEQTERSIVERCYDEESGLFYSLSRAEEQQLRVPTIASLLPLCLPSLPGQIADRLVERQLLDQSSFWPEFPVPSVSLADPQFSASSDPLKQNGGLSTWLSNQMRKHHLIWRGPTWINTNWFLARGLRQKGYDRVADELAARTGEMVRRSGFWEYYNPFTGEGQGAEDFGWSTLVVDMLDDVRTPVRAGRPSDPDGRETKLKAPSAVLSPQTALQP